MILSCSHKYLFIELPHTASTSIANELIENYHGRRILYKHSAYHEFLKIASEEEKKYFVFSAIRNPLDVIVSKYFKYKTNHQEHYTNPQHWKKNGGWLNNYELSCFDFVYNQKSDFSSFFKRYYRFPYNNWSCLAHKQFHFIIRYENLQDDFFQVIKLIGLEPKRKLPLKNKTGEKRQDIRSYFTPQIQNQAKRVFGPFMKQWGYEFPPEWGNSSISWINQLEFELFSIPMKLYWRYWKRHHGNDLLQFLVFLGSWRTK